MLTVQFWKEKDEEDKRDISVGHDAYDRSEDKSEKEMGKQIMR